MGAGRKGERGGRDESAQVGQGGRARPSPYRITRKARSSRIRLPGTGSDPSDSRDMLIAASRRLPPARTPNRHQSPSRCSGLVQDFIGGSTIVWVVDHCMGDRPLYGWSRPHTVTAHTHGRPYSSLVHDFIGGKTRRLGGERVHNAGHAHSGEPPARPMPPNSPMPPAAPQR